MNNFRWFLVTVVILTAAYLGILVGIGYLDKPRTETKSTAMYEVKVIDSMPDEVAVSKSTWSCSFRAYTLVERTDNHVRIKLMGCYGKAGDVFSVKSDAPAFDY